VNRPLGAFGFLLGLLALAMFAVSSTSSLDHRRFLPAVNRHAAFSQPSRAGRVLPIAATATFEER